MFKIIVAGSRDFKDYKLLKEKLDNILSSVKDDIEIVSGTAAGADKLGERYAKENGYSVKKFPAPWEDIEGKPEWQIGERRDGTKFWKGAGHFRNEQMAKYSNAAVLFWKNVSSGTANMLGNAEAYKLKTRVIKIK